MASMKRILSKEMMTQKMLNSEKMLTSIQNQDLAHANKYFERDLKEGGSDVLLDFCHRLNASTCRNVRHFQK